MVMECEDLTMDDLEYELEEDGWWWTCGNRMSGPFNTKKDVEEHFSKWWKSIWEEARNSNGI